MKYFILSLFILAPLFFSAFFFCPFKLPYLYCFLCPMRCLWYRLRGAVLLVALGLNIKGGLFCKRICPLGTCQTLLAKISRKKILLPRILRNLKYLSLIFLAALIITTKTSPSLAYRFADLKGLLLAIFALSMLAGIFSYRFFCYNLCPLKALSELTGQKNEDN